MQCATQGLSFYRKIVFQALQKQIKALQDQLQKSRGEVAKQVGRPLASPLSC